jgi:hypothetical protein
MQPMMPVREQDACNRAVDEVMDGLDAVMRVLIKLSTSSTAAEWREGRDQIAFVGVEAIPLLVEVHYQVRDPNRAVTELTEKRLHRLAETLALVWDTGTPDRSQAGDAGAQVEGR